jgi:signal transduction histidine kinase
LVAYAFYRYRLRRLLEIERVRTRIASDLHDDIGANLTRIAILSEVAHSRLTGIRDQWPGGPGVAEGHTEPSAEISGIENPLSSIAQISRESVASMGDIVWAINPRHDHLTDLIHRMRRLAGEVFSGRKIEYEVKAPDPDTDLRLGADVRRDVLLIFKEAINNVVRHSDCSTVRIELWLEHSCLNLRIVDDGRGFDPDHPSEGNGLASMKQRARGLDGELKVTSIEARGTQVTLRVPH